MTALSKLKPHPTATKDDRSTCIGGTDARIIATGEWTELYEQKLGLRPGPDLRHVWKPQLGLATEALHAWWHSHVTGDQLADPGDRPTYSTGVSGLPAYASSTFDRWVKGADIPLELKHTNARADLRSSAEFYMPQLQWQMHVGGVQALRFSIICGNEEPVWGLVEWDADYCAKLIAQIDAFWWHVENKISPDFRATDKAMDGAATLTIAAGSVKIDGRKPYDFAHNNEWVDKARTYISEKMAADNFKNTDKQLRALIPADAEIVTGGGLQLKRDARGAFRCTILEGGAS